MKCSGRSIPVHADLAAALAAWRQVAPTSKHVIASERGGRMRPLSIVVWFNRAFKNVGLKGCSSHSGRRTFVTRAARIVHKAGGSLRDVQLLAGHRSIQTTQRYIDGDSDAQRKPVSTSLRYHQPIMPSGTLEWLENIEYVVTITLGFCVGNMSARLPGVSSLFHEREDWVRIEIETALQRNIPIIPVLLDGAVMPTRELLPRKMRDIAYRTATQVYSGVDFEHQMDRLIAGIDKILADRAGQRR